MYINTCVISYVHKFTRAEGHDHPEPLLHPTIGLRSPDAQSEAGPVCCHRVTFWQVADDQTLRIGYPHHEAKLKDKKTIKQKLVLSHFCF